MRLKNETGNKYGKLKVLQYSHSNSSGMAHWMCLCDCGNYSIVSGAHLRDGHTTSCGCLPMSIIPGWNKGLSPSKDTIAKRSSKLMGRTRPPFSDEWKKRISLASKGRTASLETRIKMSENRKGEKCHLWKGGITPEHKMIRCSFQMKQWRKYVFERDNYTCQHCGNRGGNLEAHHIKSFSEYPEHRLDINNGETLCVSCHNKTKYGNQERILPSGKVA